MRVVSQTLELLAFWTHSLRSLTKMQNLLPRSVPPRSLGRDQGRGAGRLRPLPLNPVRTTETPWTGGKDFPAPFAGQTFPLTPRRVAAGGSPLGGLGGSSLQQIALFLAEKHPHFCRNLALRKPCYAFLTSFWCAQPTCARQSVRGQKEEPQPGKAKGPLLSLGGDMSTLPNPPPDWIGGEMFPSCFYVHISPA